MKKISTLILAAFLVSGLATGCKNKTEEQAQPEAQQPAADAPTEEVKEEVKEEVEELPEEEEENIIDEAMFIKAAYEVSCVKAKIDNPEEQKEILTVIYPRYGFETVEDFTEAESSLKDSTSVKAAIESKMESCTVEAAKGFKTAGASEGEAAEEAKEEEKQEDAKKAAPKPAYKDMVYNANLDSSSVEKGKVVCAVSKGTASCRVSGLFEGKPLTLQGRGDVSRTGSFKINLKAGNNTGVIQGELKNSSGRGSFSGTVFSKPHNGSWSSR